MSLRRRETAPPRSPIVLLSFGKHKGESIASVAKYDRDYLCWLEEQEWCGAYLGEAIRETLGLD